MNHFKRAKVVILPTENKSKICLYKNILYYVMDGEFNLNREKYNLYIISDDEIKEGDWYFDGVGFIHKKSKYNDALVDGNKQAKKIIATTDTSLKQFIYTTMVIDEGDIYQSLPQPSQQFIEKYIEEYNKGNIITDVLVEYDYCPNRRTKVDLSKCPKVNPKDNTITIKKLKDSWNRNEIVNLIKNSFQKGIESQYNNWDENDFNLNKWIEENL